MFKLAIHISKSLIFPVVLIFFCGNIIAQDREWKSFSPENGEWTILAPGIMKPDAEALQKTSNKGTYSYTDYNGFFAVVYRDTPRRYVPWKPDYQAYYTKIRKDAIKAANGELVSDVEFTNGETKGREIRIKIPNNKVVERESVVKKTYRIERLRMFFHRKRFYLLLAVLPQDQINTPVIDKYLDSFTAK